MAFYRCGNGGGKGIPFTYLNEFVQGSQWHFTEDISSVRVSFSYQKRDDGWGYFYIYHSDTQTRENLVTITGDYNVWTNVSLDLTNIKEGDYIGFAITSGGKKVKDFKIEII